ncbi:MAG: sulfurtransferase [Proteobacteria bacterium]|nr:sulfurtransferase [Pseudomonadota bacterium]MBU1419075.1 sulfurtransferase [Pseudomonadota bacterium]MBU1453946.1 sulfurtransferase [Pseudomonadota bacterium]
MDELNTKKVGSCFADKLALVGLILAVAIGFVATAGTVGAETEEPASVTADRQLPKNKQTTLGLYVTAAQAYEKWKAAPEKVMVIDVRTPEEYAFVGHPEMAWNIPLAFVTYQRIDGETEYGPKVNPDFVDEVKKLAGLNDILLVTCRAGGRSAKAVNKLAEAGFKNVYTIIDGFEGDKVTDPESVFYGKRMRNGWKNSAPWVYDIDPEKIILEEYESKQTE